MSFDRPLALVALVVLPLLVALWIAWERRRHSSAAAFTSLALLPNLVDRAPGRLRLVPLALFLAALTALIVGAARPHAPVTEPKNEATVVVALDVSRSMLAQDVRPTRLAAAERAADAFAAHVPSSYDLALVAFGSRAFLALPPTQSRALFHQALADLTPGQGTALGDAVELAVQVGQRRRDTEGKVPPTSVLIFSDGANDGGRFSPQIAVRRAHALGVEVSTVLVGTANGTITRALVGGYSEQIRVPPSAATLQLIASATGGHFYRARTTSALAVVYKHLATRIGHKTVNRQLSDVFAAGAIVLLLAGGTLSALWFRRVP